MAYSHYMNIWQRIISLPLAALWKIRRRNEKTALSPEEIARRLSPDALARVQQEAAFLREMHAVKVRPLAEGELPSIPQRAAE